MKLAVILLLLSGCGALSQQVEEVEYIDGCVMRYKSVFNKKNQKSTTKYAISEGCKMEVNNLDESDKQ